jgi:prolyl-tRNA synthetase
MKLSNGFFITRRENPKDESILATKLLIKSGMVIKNTNGVYSYLPMGLRVLKNIKNIIRKEMDNINAEEVLMPVMSKYSESDFLTEEFNFLDRDNNRLKLFSSARELFSYLASFKVRSYKDLHFTLYQINHNFRDEEHVEYGLVRKKEFYTLESYSFDSDEGGLDVSYDKMFLAFKKIFSKLGLDTLVVRSSEGLLSEEFQVISKEGDNKVVKCTRCSYACNIEDATTSTITTVKEVVQKNKEIIKTPGVKTIRDLSEYLDIFPSRILKTIVIKVDNKYKMALLKGESELNIKKLKLLFKTNNVVIPTTYELEKMGIHTGYVGPIDAEIEIIADNEVKSMFNAVCGSNKKGYYYINVNPGVDFKVNRYADVKLFDSNSLCPRCKSKAEILKGIEVGHIFKLETNYSKEYNLKYTDEINEEQYVHMGSYGIGLDRCVDAIVEKHHDDKGIIWPVDIAPYKVAIVILNIDDSESFKYAKKLYEKLNDLGVDTILDDRKESVGVKFNDIDLIGIPIRITVGRKLESGYVELKLRNNEKSTDIKIDVILSKVLEEINNYVI